MRFQRYLLYQLLHVRYLWLFVLVVHILTGSSMMIDDKLVASSIDLGDHLVLLGGLRRGVVTTISTDGAG